MSAHTSWCAECGPMVMVDEDGCCATCGATCMGPYADAANNLLVALKRLAGLFASLHPNHAAWGGYKAAIAAIAKARGES